MWCCLVKVSWLWSFQLGSQWAWLQTVRDIHLYKSSELIKTLVDSAISKTDEETLDRFLSLIKSIAAFHIINWVVRQLLILLRTRPRWGDVHFIQEESDGKDLGKDTIFYCVHKRAPISPLSYHPLRLPPSTRINQNEEILGRHVSPVYPRPGKHKKGVPQLTFTSWPVSVANSLGTVTLLDCGLPVQLPPFVNVCKSVVSYTYRHHMDGVPGNPPLCTWLYVAAQRND